MTPLECLSIPDAGKMLSCSKSTIYQRLTTLRLAGFSSAPDITPVLHAFPNMRHLIFQESALVRNQETSRMSNLAAFERKPWSNLDYFEGSMDALYALGITCPINRLVIEVYPSTMFLRRPHELTQLLRTVQPTRLCTNISSWDNMALPHCVLNAISSTNSLTHLEFAMNVSEQMINSERLVVR